MLCVVCDICLLFRLYCTILFYIMIWFCMLDKQHNVCSSSTISGKVRCSIHKHSIPYNWYQTKSKEIFLIVILQKCIGMLQWFFTLNNSFISFSWLYFGLNSINSILNKLQSAMLHFVSLPDWSWPIIVDKKISCGSWQLLVLVWSICCSLECSCSISCYWSNHRRIQRFQLNHYLILT